MPHRLLLGASLMITACSDAPKKDLQHQAVDGESAMEEPGEWMAHENLEAQLLFEELALIADVSTPGRAAPMQLDLEYCWDSTSCEPGGIYQFHNTGRFEVHDYYGSSYYGNWGWKGPVFVFDYDGYTDLTYRGRLNSDQCFQGAMVNTELGLFGTWSACRP